ncbi:unnamed protein product [Closterium sp. NIES-65]|nr:unnamed protein product [Closterium sp. NIES-65]
MSVIAQFGEPLKVAESPGAATGGPVTATSGPAAATCGHADAAYGPEPPTCRTAEQPRNRAARQPDRPAAEPPSSRAAQPPSCRVAQEPCCPAAEPPCRRAAQQPSRLAAEPPCRRAAEPPSRPTEEPLLFLPVRPGPPSLDWADGLSLFDLTFGASPAPAADADATVRSQWATRDAAARLGVRRHLSTTERAHLSQYKSAQTLYDAVVARYSSPATAALSRLMLPYLFLDLAAFPTVADLITHLRNSDTRYRAALPADFCAKNPPPMYITLYYIVTWLPDSLRVVKDHFLSVCPTTLTVDLLEKALLAAQKSIVAVGASRGDPHTPIFEGCSPSPLLPSVASAAAADLVGALEELAGAVEAAVEAAEGVGVAVGVAAGVEVEVAAVKAEEEAAVAAGAEVAEVAAVEEAVAEEVELVGVALRRGSAPVVRGGGAGPCTYVLRTSDRAGEQCGGAHSTQRCFGRLTDAWRHQFPEATEIPCWGELSRAGVAVFDLDFDAILAAMYAVTSSDEGDCYRCFLPDPGIETAALGAGEAAALGASEGAALGASASASLGAGESALSGSASASASLTFTLDSGASRSFFRDRTTLTPLGRSVVVSLADPSGGPVLAVVHARLVVRT